MTGQLSSTGRASTLSYGSDCARLYQTRSATLDLSKLAALTDQIRGPPCSGSSTECHRRVAADSCRLAPTSIAGVQIISCLQRTQQDTRMKCAAIEDDPLPSVQAEHKHPLVGASLNSLRFGTPLKSKSEWWYLKTP